MLQRKAAAQRLLQTFGHWASYLVPQIFAFTTFVGGAILLFSGSTPAISWRLTWLETFLPLQVIEISHFLGSLVGVALLLLARSLQRRVDAAYILTLSMLGAGIVLSLLKGFDYEEAIVLSLHVRGPSSLSRSISSQRVPRRPEVSARLGWWQFSLSWFVQCGWVFSPISM